MDLHLSIEEIEHMEFDHPPVSGVPTRFLITLPSVPEYPIGSAFRISILFSRKPALGIDVLRKGLGIQDHSKLQPLFEGTTNSLNFRDRENHCLQTLEDM
jgi:hypothetical protein